MELGVTELADTEKYFFDTNKLEVNPRILMMEQRLVDTEKNIKLLVQKLAEEEQKVLAAPKRKKGLHKSEEQQLINYSKSALEHEKEKVEKLLYKEKEATKERQELLDQINIIGNEIERNKGRLYDLGEEDPRILADKINADEFKKFDMERAYKIKCGEVETLQKKCEKHQKLIASYDQFCKNMASFANRKALAIEKPKLEQMMEELKDHYEQIKATSLLELQKKYGFSTSVKELVKQSNEKLNKLENIPLKLKFEKSDLRYDIFTKIWEMIMDNITIRKQLNTHTEALNDHITKKLSPGDVPEIQDFLPLDDLVNLKAGDLERIGEDTRILLDVPSKFQTARLLFMKEENKYQAKADKIETPKP
eukprot:TRINITY_DN72625_c0_g1_i1.p1 TRINITY_DN72625_c0_g1~~TRINITY_DN72625_c0_g1_i1.p1  ORF type:complete len:365 (-),score=81.17 TRINITY_DN72625_c0_g1_i1:98-1192(-)